MRLRVEDVAGYVEVSAMTMFKILRKDRNILGGVRWILGSILLLDAAFKSLILIQLLIKMRAELPGLNHCAAKKPRHRQLALHHKLAACWYYNISCSD